MILNDSPLFGHRRRRRRRPQTRAFIALFIDRIHFILFKCIRLSLPKVCAFVSYCFTLHYRFIYTHEKDLFYLLWYVVLRYFVMTLERQADRRREDREEEAASSDDLTITFCSSFSDARSCVVEKKIFFKKSHFLYWIYVSMNTIKPTEQHIL